MLFNSFSFAIFLPIVFLLYWFVTNRNLKLQNLLLLVSSFFFYAYWDYRFLGLLVFTIFLSYISGIKMQEAKSHNIKKFWFFLSLFVNLGILGLFKYYNFFVSSFADGLSLLGIHANVWTLQIILPVGISFYTFNSLSYIIDIFNNKITPEKNLINYSVFVCFFPLLLAGPIERATHFLPQIIKKREFDYAQAVDGLRQILWGLFKKIVIADNCAKYANQIFDTYQTQNGSTLFLGALFFAFQIYADFSGYSDMAIGTAKLFGIELLRNFAFPYFSVDISDFWRRWHISLTSWLRDYLFLPLSFYFSEKLYKEKYFFITSEKWIYILATSITFLLCGLWHGSQWTFIIWGGLHGFYLIFALFTKKRRLKFSKQIGLNKLPRFNTFLQILITFFLTTIGWIFFRANTVGQAVEYIEKLFGRSLLLSPMHITGISKTLGFTAILLIVEWLQRNKKHGLELSFNNHFLKWIIYYATIAVILEFGANSQSFIYFQF